MSDVLGFDCDGRPLRLGDRVVFVGRLRQMDAHIRHRKDDVFIVSGSASQWVREHFGDHMVHLGDGVHGDPSCLRRITPCVDHTPGSWKAINLITGWKPPEVSA